MAHLRPTGRLDQAGQDRVDVDAGRLAGVDVELGEGVDGPVGGVEPLRAARALAAPDRVERALEAVGETLDRLESDRARGALEIVRLAEELLQLLGAGRRIVAVVLEPEQEAVELANPLDQLGAERAPELLPAGIGNGHRRDQTL